MTGAMGTSVVTTIWENRAAMHHAHLSEPLSEVGGNLPYTLGQMGLSGINANQSLAQVNRLMDQQAFTKSATDIFLASGVLFLFLIGLIWLTKRPKKSGQALVKDAGGAH
jgi:DHA2 family multidrug resistance protein